MSARWSVVLQDTAGNVLISQVVKLYLSDKTTWKADFTEIGSGEYRVDYGTTGKYSISVGGSFPAALDGIEIVFDDTVYKALLASTASGEGANLVGVHDAGARITGITVEAALTEVPTKVELASTASGNGASTVGIQDAGGYYAGANVEAALQEVGGINLALAGLTATAAELNKLDGANASVTPANLSSLCGAGLSAGIELHTHAMDKLGAAILQPQKLAGMDGNLWIRSQESYGGTLKGDVILDPYHQDDDGHAQVRKKNESGQATVFDILTAYEGGDLNLSGDPILGGITLPGKITKALLQLAAKIFNIQTGLSAAGSTGIVQGESKIAARGVVAADLIYTDAGTDYWSVAGIADRKFWHQIVPAVPGKTNVLRVRFLGKTSGASASGPLSLRIQTGDSTITELAQVTISGNTWKEYSVMTSWSGEYVINGTPTLYEKHFALALVPGEVVTLYVKKVLWEFWTTD